MIQTDQRPTYQSSNIDDDEIEPEGIITRIGRVVVALLLVIGLLYLVAGRQYFFLTRTPERIEQAPVVSTLEAEQLVVPLTIFIASGLDGVGSERTESDARRLVENAARIWEQANIGFIIENTILLPLSKDEWQIFADTPRAFIASVTAYNPSTINVFLMGNLNGINGLSFGGINSVAVADYTSVYDFRALAHEIGHTLGLDHVSGSQGQLMYRGANGFELSANEITRARQTAAEF